MGTLAIFAAQILRPTYSTSSRHGGKAKAGSAAALAIHEKNTQSPTLNVQLKRSDKKFDFAAKVVDILVDKVILTKDRD